MCGVTEKKVKSELVKGGNLEVHPEVLVITRTRR
jgi:hypothetical protein